METQKVSCKNPRGIHREIIGRIHGAFLENPLEQSLSQIPGETL